MADEKIGPQRTLLGLRRPFGGRAQKNGYASDRARPKIKQATVVRFKV